MSKPKVPKQSWPGYTYFASPVTGVVDYQLALKQLVGNHGDKKCRVIAEGQVLSDGNGRFSVTINGAMVGFLPTSAAERLQERLKAMGTDGQPLGAVALIIGGHKLEDGTTAYYGVRLELSPSDLWPAYVMISESKESTGLGSNQIARDKHP